MTFERPSLIEWFSWNKSGNALSDENRRIAFIGMCPRMGLVALVALVVLLDPS